MTFPHLKTKRLVKSTTRLSETSTFRTPKKKWNGFEFREGSSSKHFCSRCNLLSVFQVVPGKHPRIKLVVSVGWYQIITMEKCVEIAIFIQLKLVVYHVSYLQENDPPTNDPTAIRSVFFSGSRYTLHKFRTQN